jgi:hypothetical protein
MASWLQAVEEDQGQQVAAMACLEEEAAVASPHAAVAATVAGRAAGAPKWPAQC